MLVKTYGSAVYGVDALTITIEVSIVSGTKYFVVGLPDNAVKESMFRVASAISISGYRMPRPNARRTHGFFRLPGSLL